MGSTWSFLLMFESWVKRHSFCGIEALNGYMYSASLSVFNGPLGLGHHRNDQVLRNKVIPLVKVLWMNHDRYEAI